MLENIKLFATDNNRLSYEDSGNYVEPYVSLVEGDNSVHYNKPKFFCKLTLNDDSVIELEGSGQLTTVMINPYRSTVVSAKIGTLCTSINTGVFGNCSEITEVIIGNAVATINSMLFYGCSSLTSVTVEATTPPILNGPIFNVAPPIIYVPAESVNAYKTANGWSDYASYIQPIPTT